MTKSFISCIGEACLALVLLPLVVGLFLTFFISPFIAAWFFIDYLAWNSWGIIPALMACILQFAFVIYMDW